MKKVEVEVSDIALSGSSSGAYAMVLSEVEGNRKLPIVIGGAEAPGPIAGRGLDMMTLAIEALDPRWTDLGPDRLLEASLSLAGRGRYNP